MLPVELASTVDGAVIVAFGLGETLTVFDAVAEHPFASVTVTLYVVVADGETVVAAVVAPVLQRYEVPPDAVNVTELPAHIVAGPVIVAVAGAFTETVFDALAEQPLESVTCTV